MKILKAHNYYLIGGGEDKSNQAEIELLKQYNNVVDFYTENNEKIKALGLIKTAIKTIWSQQSYSEIRYILNRDKYDIFHCENTFPLISPSAYYAAKAEGVPVIQTLRNYRFFCLNAYLFRDNQVCEDCLGKPIPLPGIIHSCYRNSKSGSLVLATMLSIHRLLRTYQRQVDIFIALTDFAKRKYIEGGLPKEKILIKPNFIYPDPGIGEGEGEFALFVGRLSPEKGINVLLEAWQKLDDNIALKIIGDGPLANVVTQFADKLSNVEYLGKQPIDIIYEIMGQAKALIFPSLWYEGLPRVIIEAYAKGTPVIASRLGSMETLIEHQRTGLHFSPGCAEELIQQVHWMLTYSNVWQQMRLEARLEYERYYTAEKNYQRLMEIYQLAIESVKSKSF